MSLSIPYPDFVEYRAKLNQAGDDMANNKKSAASNRLRSVKKNLDDLQAKRNDLNCESEGRLNFLQKLYDEVSTTS